MKHVKRITVVRAEQSASELSGILDSVFGFVLTLTQTKGKGRPENTY
jgi:hypothetical protein